MDNKRKLTTAFINKEWKPEKRLEIYDTLVESLALRITPTGHKSFVFRYRFKGKVKRYTIESYPKISLAQAREKAKVLSYQVKNDHKDPLRERQKAQSTPEPITFLEVIELYKQKHFLKLKQSTQDDYERRIDHFINDFGKSKLKRPIRDFKRIEVLNWLEDKAASAPTNAQRLQAILSGIFNFAKSRELVDTNIVKGVNFTEERKKAVKKWKNVAFDEGQIQKLWIAFDEYGGLSGNLFKLLMILGQRVGETRHMKWQDIDFENGRWNLPSKDTKNEEPHQVLLPELALDILDTLRPFTGDSTYVFESPVKKNQPIEHPSKAAQRIRKRSGINQFNIHSLRTTFITWQAKLGTSQHVTSKLVNHKSGGEGSMITALYDKYDYDYEKRIALNKWSNELNRILSGDKIKIHKLSSSS